MEGKMEETETMSVLASGCWSRSPGHASLGRSVGHGWLVGGFEVAAIAGWLRDDGR
jgi:hypothetical protein